MAAPGSSFVNCTALGKNLDVRPLVTLIEESPWEVDPGGIPREAISSIAKVPCSGRKRISEKMSVAAQFKTSLNSKLASTTNSQTESS